MPKSTDARDIQSEVELATQPAIDRLRHSSSWAHQRGFLAWANKLGNLATRIEKERDAAILELEEGN